MNNLQNAPPEVFANIAISLSYNELEQLCRTNPNIRSLCNNDQFWYQRTRQDFRDSNKPNDLSWKEYYLTLLNEKRRQEREMRQKMEQIKYFDEVERPHVSKSVHMFAGMPADMNYNILLNLDLANVIRVCQSNRNFYPICQSEVFWFDKTLNDNPSLNLDQLIRDKPLDLSWREYYRQLINK